MRLQIADVGLRGQSLAFAVLRLVTKIATSSSTSLMSGVKREVLITLLPSRSSNQ